MCNFVVLNASADDDQTDFDELKLDRNKNMKTKLIPILGSSF